jgi:hypothetical protein
MSTGATIVLIVVLLAVVLAVGWFVGSRLRSRKLRDRFGPEYDRRIEAADNRRVAERELTERQKRHAGFELRPLSDDARDRYAEQWALVQEQFVDQPVAAVAEADSLVQNVMRERGYPTEGFDQQAEDLSVEHATAVNHYRSAHDVRVRNEASTEDLRQALVDYRKIFVSLVGVDSEADRTETSAIDRAETDRPDTDRTDTDRTDTDDSDTDDRRPHDASR